MQSADKYIRESISSLFSTREASQISLMILESVCGLSRTDILMGKDNLNESQHKIIDDIISQLKTQRPIQYILGNTDFMNLKFKVAEGVLIPRPETAELINIIIDENKTDNPTILDIGTGSGCIAVSLAHYITNSDVTAFDISDRAISIATENATSNNVNIKFIQKDILNCDCSQFHNQFDIIVSNPPYICEKEKESMHNNVLDFEPHIALFVSNEDPLIFYRTIVNLATQMLKSNGKLYFEINEAFGKETAQLLIDAGFSDVKIINDLQQKERMVCVTLIKN